LELYHDFGPEGITSSSTIESTLCEHYEYMKDLFLDAFSLLDRAVDGADVFVVFIARRCFILSALFLRSLIHRLGYERYFERQRHILSDGGLRIQVKTIAEKFFYDDSYKCEIYLYDDILIHGRSIGSLLSSAESIFANTYLALKEKNPAEGRDYTRTELHDIFLNFVTIKIGYINTQPNLLRERYKSKLTITSKNYVEPRIWRDMSNRITKLIFDAQIPNAAFIPGIMFGRISDISSRQTVKKRFAHFMDVNHGFRTWRCVESEYNDRKMDCYLAVIPSETNIQSVFSIRCTDNYMIPFVFLQRIDSQWLLKIENGIVSRLKKREYGFNQINDLQYLLRGLSNADKLTSIYAELITMILSISLLRSFLEDLHFSVITSAIDAAEYIKKYTTLPIIMSNYAYNSTIEHLAEYLLNPDIIPLFTISELRDLISDHDSTAGNIIEKIGDITIQPLDENDKNRFIDRLEKVVFRYGADSEQEAFRISTGYIAPSYESVEYFYFPLKNNLENVIFGLYDDSGWMAQHVSVEDAFTYILQLMDYGSLALTTGTDKEDNYFQCLKAGEQSLNEMAKRYALCLPIMREIEKRCSRQGRQNKQAFYDELRYFTFILYSEFRNRLHGNNPLVEACRQIIKDRENIKQFEDFLYDSGNSARDYRFATVEALNKRSAGDYYQYKNKCKKLYYSVVY